MLLPDGIKSAADVSEALAGRCNECSAINAVNSKFLSVNLQQVNGVLSLSKDAVNDPNECKWKAIVNIEKESLQK